MHEKRSFANVAIIAVDVAGSSELAFALPIDFTIIAFGNASNIATTKAMDLSAHWFHAFSNIYSINYDTEHLDLVITTESV